METIYLDNNATTFPAPEAVEAALPFIGEMYANPNSSHSFGQKTRHAIEKARASVAEMMAAKTEEIIFTSGATEANTTAIRSALKALPDRKHVITSRIDHPSVLDVVRGLKSDGYRVTEIAVGRDGQINLEELKNEISGDTALVATHWANNETGVVFPVAEIGDIAKQYGALFHVDAVQAAGKLAMDLKEVNCIDTLSLSGHKFHALKGAGVLYVRAGTTFAPLLRGGHQESGHRAGTENVLGIVSMGAAASDITKHLKAHRNTMLARTQRLRDGLRENCEHIVFHGPEIEDARLRLPNTLSVGFRNVDAEALLMMLDSEGVAVTAGSACQSGSMEPSFVLRAMNVPLSTLHSSVRFCVSRYTTEQEVDKAVERIAKVVKRLREFSPFDAATDPDNGPTDDELATARAYFAGQ